MAGLIRLVVRVCEALAKGGLGNLRNTIGGYEERQVDSSRLSPLPASRYILPLEEIDLANARSIEDIAVHAHIYYAELTPEIRYYLENIPAPFNLYVTTDTEDKAANIKSTLAGMGNVRALDIRIVPNRGRDIGPMLVELGDTLARHEVVLHIHTKRSPHNPNLRGWRRYLMQALLGNSRLVATILDRFARDEQLGILYPQVYHPIIPFMRIGGNAAGISAILRKAGRDAEEIGKLDMSAFPAGFMLWFRGSSLEPFIHMKLGIEDFDAEAGQDDSTLAHAIERVFPYLVNIGGLHPQAFLPVRMLDPAYPGAVPLSELLPALPTSSSGTCIIFDDDNVSDVKQNSRTLINEAISNGHSVLRIYYLNCAWFVDWVAADDGMIFVESSIDAVFDVLAKVDVESIIVNSLYCPYPDINRFVECIEAIAKSSGIQVDYKVQGSFQSAVLSS